jgi:hypothetical protein
VQDDDEEAPVAAARRSHVEAVLAKTLRCPPAELPARLHALKTSRSYVELAEYLTAKGALVGKTWLFEYLRDHPPA